MTENGLYIIQERGPLKPQLSIDSIPIQTDVHLLIRNGRITDSQIRLAPPNHHSPASNTVDDSSPEDEVEDTAGPSSAQLNTLLKGVAIHETPDFCTLLSSHHTTSDHLVGNGEAQGVMRWLNGIFGQAGGIRT